MSTHDSVDDEPMFDERITSYPWPVGIMAGMVTFVAGLLVMGAYILAGGGTREGASLTGTPGRVFTDVGMTFYNAHNVVLNVQINAPDIINTGPSKVDYLSGATTLPKPIYYAIPIVVLVVAGVVVTRQTLGENASVTEAVLPGAAVSIGYTATAVVGTFLIRDSRGGGDVVLAPDLVQTVTYALAYSLAFGLVGSLLVVAAHNRDELRRRFAR